MSNHFDISTCPVCDHTEFELFKKVPDWLVSKELFDIHRCTACNFKFTSNAPTEVNVGPYYNSEEYVEHSDTNKGLIYSVYHKARELMLRYKLHIIKKRVEGKKVLDIGSGSGYFLNHMMQNGYDVTGVEISEKARDLCFDKFSIKANVPQDFLDKKLGNDYDLISLWHVFEHVYTYEEYFDLFAKSLNNKGKLILALPNSNSADADIYKEHWAAYDTPRHLWHFTPHTIEQFARHRGFVLERKYRLPLDPFFNAMVSASYKDSFTFLPTTMLKALWSYLVSLIQLDKSSSLIYVFRKA